MSDHPDSVLAVHEHIDINFDRHLEATRAMLRQRSISADGTGIEEMALMLSDWLTRLGGESQVVATPGNPVVFGRFDVGAPQTLMIYGMYDTMPVEGEQWLCDPFEGAILDLPDVGRSIVARGSENSKGPLAAFLNVLESWQAVHGTLPVNIKIVVEGEEELGSPSLPAFVRDNASELAADHGMYPYMNQTRSGKPIFRLGFKGILFLELRVRGGAWGGPVDRAAHSSTAVWFDSPTILMVHALASLFSQDQRRILIDGFYDNVAPISDDDLALLEKLADTFDAAEVLAQEGIHKFKWDLEGVELLKKYLFEPSLNIAGLISGDVGPGAKTILPHDAFAKIGFRLVPNQDPDRILRLLKEHFQRHGFSQIDVHLHDVTHWSRTPVSSVPVQAAIQATRDFGLEPEVWPTHAGSAPISLFTDDLGIPMTPMGLGHGGGAHGPNEYITVQGLQLCEKSLASFLARYVEMTAAGLNAEDG
ncbi:MAG: M20/M25/M40 family metallo-hydrolase [Anaerolineales bacterium]|nr:M20/M25/M40 family metallo-hydrolase [Anaerolineales bacterium]